MNHVRVFEWLGSTALTMALMAMFLVFVPGLVRAETPNRVKDCAPIPIDSGQDKVVAIFSTF